VAKGKEHAPYVPLNVHSFYSLIGNHKVVATSSPESLVQSAHDKGFESLAPSETNLFSLGRFFRACEKHGIKLIPAVELPVDFGLTTKLENTTFIAKNNEGLADLFDLASIVHSDKRRLEVWDLFGKFDNIYIILRGDPDSFEGLLDEPNIYLAIETQDREKIREIKSNENLQGKTIYTPEFRLASRSEERLFGILIRLFQEKNGINYKPASEYVLKPPIFDYKLADEIAKTHEIAQEVDVDIPKSPELKATNVPEGMTSKDYLTEIVWEATERLIDSGRFSNVEEEKIRARIAKELTISQSLDLNDFFLICLQVKEFCNSRRIKCRLSGSAANSIVFFVLGVNDVYPIDLYFERFLNEARFLVDGVRHGHPDVDFDIESSGRDAVARFLTDEYDIAKPIAIVHKLGIKGVESLERQRGITLTDRERVLVANAGITYKFISHPGIAFTGNLPLIKSGRNIIAQNDKVDSDDIYGFAKVDLLKKIWAKRISQIEALLELDSTKLVYRQNDPRTFDRIFRQVKTIGITNLETPLMQQTLGRIGVLLDKASIQPEIHHIAQSLALIRPAARTTKYGYEGELRGILSFFSKIPEIKKILGKTNFVIIYPEQVMQIATDAAGLSYGFANQIRKALGKGDEENLEGLFARLKNALFEKFEHYIAEGLMDQVESFTGYGFVEGHAYSQALDVYELAYLAEHYNPYFWPVVLNTVAEHGSRLYSTQDYINAALDDGNKFVFPESLEKKFWIESFEEKSIGVGEKLLKKSSGLSKRKFRNVYDRFIQMLESDEVSKEEIKNYQLTNFKICLTHSVS